MKKTNFYIFLTVFGLFFMLSYLFPYTADDFTWAKNSLSFYFNPSHLFDYDGRYFGNSLTLIFGKIPLLLHFVYAIFMVFIVDLVKRIFENRWIFMGVLILLLTTSREVFAQTFGWKAGYFNYVASIVFPLLLIVLVKELVLERKELHFFSNYSTSKRVLVIACSLIFQWMSEPVSILNVISILCFIAYQVVMKIKVHKVWTDVAIGTVAGAILMFANKGYYRSFTGQDKYRSVGGGLETVYFNFKEIIQQLMINNQVLMIVLTLVVSVVIAKKWNFLKTKTKIILFFNSGFMISFLSYFYFMNSVTDKFPKHDFFGVVLAVLFMLSLLSSVMILSNNDLINLYLILASVLLVLPYIIIQPFGARCVFGSIVLLSILAMRLIANNFSELDLRMVMSIILIGIFSYYFSLGYVIHAATNRNIEFLTYQVDKKRDKLIYLQVPNGGYYWNPENDRQEDNPRFQRYYNLPKGKGKLVNYEDWQANKKLSNKELLEVYK